MFGYVFYLIIGLGASALVIKIIAWLFLGAQKGVQSAGKEIKTNPIPFIIMIVIFIILLIGALSKK
jgi:hypothetical protein